MHCFSVDGSLCNPEFCGGCWSPGPSKEILTPLTGAGERDPHFLGHTQLEWIDPGLCACLLSFSLSLFLSFPIFSSHPPPFCQLFHLGEMTCRNSLELHNEALEGLHPTALGTKDGSWTPSEPPSSQAGSSPLVCHCRQSDEDQSAEGRMLVICPQYQ